MVTIYKSTDEGAPILTGQPGSVIALLDQILVGDGGIAYGSTPSLGWTKEFTGTNMAAYRMNPNAPGSSGAYLKITNSGGGWNVFARMYKTMTSIDSGTVETPNSASFSAYWAMCETNDSSPRPWCIIGDDRTFYITTIPNRSSWNSADAYLWCAGAGDYDSFVPGHQHNYFMISGNNTYDIYSAYSNYSNFGTRGQFISIGSDSIDGGTCADAGFLGLGAGSASQFQPAYPNVYTGLVHSFDALVHDAYGIAGRFRGIKGQGSRPLSAWLHRFGVSLETPEEEKMFQFFCRHPSSGWVQGGFLVKPTDW